MTSRPAALALLVLLFQVGPLSFSPFKRDSVPAPSDCSENPVGASSCTHADDETNLALDGAFRNDGAALLRYLRRHAGPDAAPDLMQEVFLRAMGSGQRNRLLSPAAFLRRIARNLLLNRARWHRRNNVVLLPLQEDHDAISPPEQELEIEAADLLRLYEEAVDAMPNKTQRVFLMHRVDGLSYREIHERLEISIATVEYHMMKALAHIANVLETGR